MFKAPTINQDHIILTERCISGYHNCMKILAAEPGTELYQLGQDYSHMMSEFSANKLDLSGLHLNDAEFIQMLPEIANLTRVTLLYLNNNEITGVALSHLRKAIPHLEELRVNETKILLNDGCGEIAKFKNLKLVFVDDNKLNSEEYEKLQQSMSLLRVSQSGNSKVDIVRQARLLGALEYNNKARMQVSVGLDTMSISKDEYIRTHFEEFRKKAKSRNQTTAMAISIMRGPPPNIKTNPPFGFTIVK